MATAAYLDGYGGGEASSYASYNGYAGGGGGGYAAAAAPQVQANYYAAPVRKEEPVYDYYVSRDKNFWELL